ncbi:MAG: hypothetical protein ABSB15_01625 [Bryobacteraceae bacterium]
MRCCLIPLTTLFLFGAEALFAGDPTWKSKPVSKWNEEDAKQILADSPWVKHVTPVWLRDLSPFERRDGGNMNEGIGKGVGLAAITGIFNTETEEEAIARAHAKPRPDPVTVQWESALPVRTAEQKAGQTEIPPLNSDDYAIAVYGIPLPKRYNLNSELKGLAAIHRYQKKDLKPSRVEILRHEDGKATVVYLFPRKVEITKKDGGIEFTAQIGRLFLAQYFYTSEMLIHDELEVLLPTN